MKQKPPDNSRRVLTWVRDTVGYEYWQFDYYLLHSGWCEARPWNMKVLYWKEEDLKPEYEEGE